MVDTDRDTDRGAGMDRDMDRDGSRCSSWRDEGAWAVSVNFRDKPGKTSTRTI